MKALGDLELFVATAEHGSLSAAARSRSLTPAAASAAVKRLEAELDTTLFVRSTRSLRLTGDGERFLAYCRDALRTIGDGELELRGDRAELRGTLQLSAPSDLGRNVVLDWLDRFLRQHPRLQLRLQLSDRFADVYRQRIDVALRYGPLPDSSLISLPLAPDNRRVLCASPAYLRRHGTPASPDELGDHACLRLVLRDEIYDRWRVFSRTGEQRTVRVRGDRVSDDGEVVHRWALSGAGIAYKSWLDVAGDVAAGRLRIVCPEWIGEPAPLYLVCPDRRLIGPTVHKLHEFLQSNCKKLSPPPIPRSLSA